MERVQLKYKGVEYPEFTIDIEGNVYKRDKPVSRRGNFVYIRLEGVKYGCTVTTAVLESFTGVYIAPIKLHFEGQSHLKNVRGTKEVNFEVIKAISDYFKEEMPLEVIYMNSEHVKFPEMPGGKIPEPKLAEAYGRFKQMNGNGTLVDEARRFMIYHGWCDETIFHDTKYHEEYLARYTLLWESQLDKLRNPDFLIEALESRDYDRFISGDFYDVTDSKNRMVAIGKGITYSTLIRTILERDTKSGRVFLKGHPGVVIKVDDSEEGLNSLISIYRLVNKKG